MDFIDLYFWVGVTVTISALVTAVWVGYHAFKNFGDFTEEEERSQSFNGEESILLPRTLQKKLDQHAEQQGVSRQMLIVLYLTGATSAVEQGKFHSDQIAVGVKELSKAARGFRNAANRIDQRDISANEHADGPYQDSKLNELTAQADYE